KKLSLEAKEAESLKRSASAAGAGMPMGGGAEPIVMVDPSDAAKLESETARRGTTKVPIVMLDKGDTGKYRGGGSGGAAPEDVERVQESIGGVIEDICHDINISIDYFENQYDKKVEEIFITGGASNTPGLPETLERTVQKPVNRWNPLQHFEADVPRDSAQELQDHVSQAAIALGLASRISG